MVYLNLFGAALIGKSASTQLQEKNLNLNSKISS